MDPSLILQQLKQGLLGTETGGRPEQLPQLQRQAHLLSPIGLAHQLVQGSGRCRHPLAVVTGDGGLHQQGQGPKAIALAKASQKFDPQGIQIHRLQGAARGQSFLGQGVGRRHPGDQQIGGGAQSAAGAHQGQHLTFGSQAQMHVHPGVDPHEFIGQLLGQAFEIGAGDLVFAQAGREQQVEILGGLPLCRAAAGQQHESQQGSQ